MDYQWYTRRFHHPCGSHWRRGSQGDLDGSLSDKNNRLSGRKETEKDRQSLVGYSGTLLRQLPYSTTIFARRDEPGLLLHDDQFPGRTVGCGARGSLQNGASPGVRNQLWQRASRIWSTDRIVSGLAPPFCGAYDQHRSGEMALLSGARSDESRRKMYS